MGPISKALDNLKFTIPIQVLREAFKDDQANWRRAPISLDEQILTKVIRPRVLIDCNLVGGQTVIVPLDGLAPEYVDNFSAVYHIPKDRTQNRVIVSVLSVGYMPYATAFNSSGIGYGNVAPGSMNEITSVAQRLSDSQSGIPPISNANVTLIGENTILLRDQFRVTSTYILRCVVSNEENLNNINPRSYLNFATLCELAVKSFIYNTLLFRVGQAFLQGGQELGEMKAYVESLSDSESMYRTHLSEVWKPTSFMNDVYAYDRHIKMMVNGGV